MLGNSLTAIATLLSSEFAIICSFYELYKFSNFGLTFKVYSIC